MAEILCVVSLMRNRIADSYRRAAKDTVFCCGGPIRAAPQAIRKRHTKVANAQMRAAYPLEFAVQW
jgi:hypothetical protein